MTESVTEEAARILEFAASASLKIATAESCTGGLLAALLTEIEGVSHAYERGFIAYTDEAKSEVLDVDAAVLERCSAVSAPVAEQMAAGALKRSRADVAISITGYAGGAEDPEPGLVYFGLAAKGAVPRSTSARFDEDTRARVRLASIRMALALLMDGLQLAAQTAALARPHEANAKLPA